MTFSSMGDILSEQLQEVDDLCNVHQVKKVTAFGREPVCLECAKELIEQENRDLESKLTQRHLKSTSYDWLRKRSILLDNTLKDATFDGFETMDDETKRNKEKALEIARKYYKGGTFNTILSGKAGTGKSHLAMSMLKVINEHSEPYRKCLFVSIDEVMRLIRESFGNRQDDFTEQKLIRLMVDADLLVIDDLGAESGAVGSEKQATDFITRTLYAIINGRMDKSTIITTNLSSKQMAQMYDSKLVSRMMKGAKGHILTFNETNDKRMEIEF